MVLVELAAVRRTLEIPKLRQGSDVGGSLSSAALR